MAATTDAAGSLPPFTQRREFWTMLSYAGVLGVTGAVVALAFLGVVHRGSTWFAVTDNAWFGGAWWW
jgi:hypothetical protein